MPFIFFLCLSNVLTFPELSHEFFVRDGLVHGTVDLNVEKLALVLIEFANEDESLFENAQLHVQRLLCRHTHVYIFYRILLEVAGRQTPLFFKILRKLNCFRKTLNTIFVSIFHKEVISKCQNSRACRLRNDSEYQFRMEQNRKLANKVTLFKRFQHTKPSAIIDDFKINAAVDDKENFVTILVEVQNYVVFLVDEVLHIKLNLCQEALLVLVWLEILNLFQKFDFELNPRIVV